MKTWHLRMSRNMFKMIFSLKHAWKHRRTALCLCSCVHGFEPMYVACVHAYVARLHAYTGLFMRIRICSSVHMHAGSNLCMRTQTRAYMCMSLDKNPILKSFFVCFSTNFKSNIFLHHFVSNCKPNIIFYLILNLTSSFSLFFANPSPVFQYKK